MKGFITNNFTADIASINAYYGWPNSKGTTTWQAHPIIGTDKKEYIVYESRIHQWCLANGKLDDIVEIPLPPPNDPTP